MAGDQERVTGLARLERLVAHLEDSGWKRSAPAAGKAAAATRPSTDVEGADVKVETRDRDAAADLELPARIPTELPKFLDDVAEPTAQNVLPDWQPANPSLAQRAMAALRPHVNALAIHRVGTRRAAVVAVTAGAAALAALGISLERRPVASEAQTIEEPAIERLSFIGGAAAAAIEAAMAPRSSAAAEPAATGDKAEETVRRLTQRRSLLDEEERAEAVAAPTATRPANITAAAVPTPEPAKTAEARGPVLVRDLPAGSVLSVGTRLSDTVWLVEAQELSSVVVTLPSNAPDQFRATIAPLGGEAARGTISLEVRRTARLEPSASSGANVPAAVPAEIPQVPPALSIAPTPPPPAVNAKGLPRAKDDSKGVPRTSATPKAGALPKVTYGGAVVAPPAARAAGARESANAAAPSRPKVIAPAAVKQPPAYESATGVRVIGKPKTPQPQVVQKNAAPRGAPLAPPSALGAPPPPPSDSGPGWLFKFLTE